MDEELKEFKKSILKSGTTLVGIVCKDGVIMAADRQITAGNMIVGKDYIKIYPVNDYLLASFTGGVSDAQLLKKVIAAELKLKELKSKSRPTVKEGANLFAMITFRNIRQPAMIPSIVGTLTAGVDEDGTASLYTIDPSGSVVKVEDYDANFGSGMPYVLGVLERGWKKDISIKEGIDLAIEALKASTQRDTGSGFGIDVFTVTKEGIKHLIKQQILPNFKNNQ